MTLDDLVGLQRSSDSQCAFLPDIGPGSQSTPDIQCPSAAGAPSNPPAMSFPTPKQSAPVGPSSLSAKSAPSPKERPQTGPNPPAMDKSKPISEARAREAVQPSMDDVQPNDSSLAGPILADPVLGLMADVVDDLESVRIANANRLRQLTDTGERGHGLTEANPEVRRLAAMVETLEKAEHDAVLNLQRAMRQHPLGAWVKATAGVGEKQAARLLASIRDPYWNDLHDRPRQVSELWAYCGLHTIEALAGQSRSDSQKLRAADDSHPGSQSTHATQYPRAARVAPTRRRGEKANWNAQARQRVWLIAQSCLKVRHSPYRDIYDQTRLHYADAVHEVPCARCGPAGTPAEPGSPLSAGHQHARAVRAMCKHILVDLWREARRLHQPTDTEGEGTA